MANCRGCGAEIIWANAKNARIPLDAKPEKRFVLTAKEPATPAALVVDTYISHFATCPKAGEFRKKGDRRAAP